MVPLGNSAVDPALHVLGVALTAQVDPVGCFGDLLQVLGGELDVDCAGVLLQALDLRGSRDRYDPGA